MFKYLFLSLFILISIPFSCAMDEKELSRKTISLPNPLSLTDPEKNNVTFYTKRLVAYPPTEEHIKKMAKILNQSTEDGSLNGKYYESGAEKDEAWVKKKYNQIVLGDLENGRINCRFFALKEDPLNVLCFIGGEREFLEDNKRGSTTMLYWGTDSKFQGQGLTSEALRGFLKADVSRDTSCTSIVASIHPENKASQALAEKVLSAKKVREGTNFLKTQLRHFYEVDYLKLCEVAKEYPAVEWGAEPK